MNRLHFACCVLAFLQRRTALVSTDEHQKSSRAALPREALPVAQTSVEEAEQQTHAARRSPEKLVGVVLDAGGRWMRRHDSGARRPKTSSTESTSWLSTPATATAPGHKDPDGNAGAEHSWLQRMAPSRGLMVAYGTLITSIVLALIATAFGCTLRSKAAGNLADLGRANTVSWMPSCPRGLPNFSSSRSTNSSNSSPERSNDMMTTGKAPAQAKVPAGKKAESLGTGLESEDKSMMGACFCATTWMLLSGSLTLYNAWMFADNGGKFPFVIFLTCWHQFLNTVLAGSIRVFCPSLMPSAASVDRPPWFDVVKVVAVPALLLTTTLSLGNEAYLYQSVSLIQMVKAGMPLMTYVIACLLGMEGITGSMLFVVCAMILGTSLTVAGEITLSMVGLALQLSSFCAEGLRLVCLKRVVSSHGINLDPLSGLLFYAPMCFLGLLSLHFFTGEYQKVYLHVLPWGHLLANGSLACSLNVASVFLLRECSATTLAVCGVLKDLVLVVLSTRLFGNVLTTQQLIGFAMVLSAIYTYSHLKQDPHCLTGKLNALKSRLSSSKG